MAEVIYISSDDNEEEIASHSTSLPPANINNIESNTIASNTNNIESRTIASNNNNIESTTVASNNNIESKTVASNHNNHIESRTVATNSGSQSRPIADCKSPINVNTATPVMSASSMPNNSGYETMQQFLKLCKPHIDNLPNLSMDELHKFALKSFRNSSPTFRNSKIFIDNLLLRVGQLEYGEKHACLYLEEICSMLKNHKRKADEQDPGEVSSKKKKTSQAVSDPSERKQQRKKKRPTLPIATDRLASSSTTSPVATISSITRVVQGNPNENDNRSNSPVIILDSDTSPQSSNPNSILQTGNQRTTNKESEDPSASNNNSNSIYVISDETPPQISPKKKRRLQPELIDISDISTDDLEPSISHVAASSKGTVSGTDIGYDKTEKHPQSSETTTEKVLDSCSSSCIRSCSIAKVDNCESPIIIIDPTPTCSPSLKQGASGAGDQNIKLINGNSSETLQHAASNSNSQAHCSSQEPLNSESKESQPQSNGNSQEFSLATLNPSVNEKIVKCEKYLKILHAEIKRLQELELSMDDLMLSDSSYIQECRLKAKVVDVYKRLCDLQSISVTSNLSTHRNIQVTSSRFPEINQKVQSYINKTKKFPDFASVKYLVKQASKQNNINLSRREIQSISLDMFQSVGKILKSQRIKDYTLFSGSHLTDNVSQTEDPAEKNSELKKKLDDNKIKGQAAMQAELTKYVVKQNSQARPSSASSSQQQPGTSTATNTNELNNITQDSDSDAEDPLKVDAESSEGEDDEEEEEDDEEEDDV